MPTGDLTDRAILPRMPTPTADSPHPGADQGRRRPEQLLLAFLGELVVDRDLGPLPSTVLIALLTELDVGAAATRAALTRMTGRDLLEPVRAGRTVSYRLTPTSERVLREARGRVFAQDPFAPQGTGWTLVTYSVPEAQRAVRHRVRAQLTWAGFGLLRDGLWIAPGEVDVTEVLGEVRDDDHVAHGDLELAAFRAQEVPGFSVARSVRTAWHLDRIRSRHVEFQRRWADRTPGGDPTTALSDLTALVADWLDLLRAVPRLPAEHLSADWPGARSVALFHRLHTGLSAPARAELGRRLAP
jgi:phenylacetic acid degradation operon negative regulatory protein